MSVMEELEFTESRLTILSRRRLGGAFRNFPSLALSVLESPPKRRILSIERATLLQGQSNDVGDLGFPATAYGQVNATGTAEAIAATVGHAHGET